MLGNRFCVLKCKEIENLIPAEVLKELVKDQFEARNRNVQKIDYADYSTRYSGLGEYLDSLLKKKTFGEPTGTLKNKINFCEKAVELMQRPDFEWKLTPALTELCSRVYKFISKQNA
jgi:hypothetical protein